MTGVAGRPPRGRFAPSPTGDLHLGGASTALLAWLSIRSKGGAFVMRLEDLDRPRVRPGSAERILQDLAWLGLDWDEGPDRGGPHAPYAQSERQELYAETFDRLKETGHVYPCFCSRKDIAASASAPQAPGDEVRYPGTCRRERVAPGEPVRSWRIRMEGEDGLDFVDGVHGDVRVQPEGAGDFVVQRGDGVPSYQLAVVVDDAAMEITEVVRGDDLVPSTHRQILLYRALGLLPPSFAHVPLLLGEDGVRLSKRHEGTSIREARASGSAPQQVIGRLAHLLGLRRDARPVEARELVDGFSIALARRAPGGIVLGSRA